MKGVVEGLFRSLRLQPPGSSPAKGMPFHPTRAARVSLDGADLGAVGELHPDVCERFDVPTGTTVLEIALGPVFAAAPGRPRAADLPRFPPILLDLAVVVDEAVPAAEVLGCIRDAGDPEVRSVRLFDVYRGDQIPDGSKSLAYSLELRDPSKTLTDEEANAVRERIVSELTSRFGATLRA